MLSLAIFLVACLLVSLSSCEVVFRFALYRLLGGVQLFGFPLAPSQSVLLVCPGRHVVFLALSSACRLVMDRRLSRFPVVWLVLRLPSLRPYAWPLFGLLAVPPFPLGVLSVCAFLDSRLLCSLASWLVLGSSFLVLVVLRLPPLRGTLFGFLILP